MAEKFIGMTYPITEDPKGYFRSNKDQASIHSDLLILLLTEPNSRVMIPEFGVSLRGLIFEPNDPFLEMQAREFIANAIRIWEPRVSVESINVSAGLPLELRHPDETGDEMDSSLYISIKFVEKDSPQNLQELNLAVPLVFGG